jgi:tRNA A-37 threonylcarbamoyl transferase component Bud32
MTSPADCNGCAALCAGEPPLVEMADERQFCELDVRGVVWHALADHPSASAVAHLPAKLSCEILRYTPRRRVLYAPGRPALLIKQYFQTGLFELAKSFFRGPPALREWRALREAEARGLPVPKALALGTRRDGAARASFLATEFIPQAVSLEDLLRDALSWPERRQIISQTALLIRRMHDAGFFHRDLHPGNLLARPGEREFELFLLDLQRTDVDPFNAQAKRWRDLACLHGGVVAASRSERLRFLTGYLSVSPGPVADHRQLVGRLERDGRRRRLRVWESRAKRCLAENREFAKAAIGGLAGSLRRGAWNDELKAALARPGGILANAEIVKGSPTTTVGILSFAGQRAFVKRYNYQGAAYALKDLFRPARARRGWKAGNSCHLRGIAVALPLGYFERRRGRVLRESYVITAALEGEELSQLLARRRGDVRFKRALIAELARWLRRIHDRGITHRDLKGENIIAQERDHGRYEFSIVDFDGIVCRRASPRIRAKNIARLVRAVAANVPITSTDRLRFVASYLRRGEASLRRKVYRTVAKLAG